MFESGPIHLYPIPLYLFPSSLVFLIMEFKYLPVYVEAPSAATVLVSSQLSDRQGGAAEDCAKCTLM